MRRAVVLCPNSFKSGWVAEIQKHGIPVTPFMYESGDDHNIRRFIKAKHDQLAIMIVNYEAIRSEKTQNYIEQFTLGFVSAIYADESIQISTHDSAQTKAAISIAKAFAFRRILSGKPMKQGPHDYWSQLRFIGLLDGKNYFAFRYRYCKMGGFKNKQVVGHQNLDELAETMGPHTFTARKADWTDLPPKAYTSREYRLTGNLKTQFDLMWDEFVAFVRNGEGMVTVDAAITKYMKLAQIQAGFIYDEQGKVHHLCEDYNNPRLALLLDVLANEVSGKVAIAYNHKPVYDTLMKALAKYNPAYIKGGMSPTEIDEQKAKFNDDPSCRVIVLQTRASKYGHTLLGQPGPDRCSTMVFYENTYSLDDRSQIEDRVHRHGQDANSVLYIDLVGTAIDQRMTEALQRKELIFAAILSAVKGEAL
jgi:hypothetical protein